MAMLSETFNETVMYFYSETNQLIVNKSLNTIHISEAI